jgi:hypothetical protein
MVAGKADQGAALCGSEPSSSPACWRRSAPELPRRPVRVFTKDTVLMVLTFDALSAAQAYVGRDQPGAVHIVQVTGSCVRE